MSEALPLLLHFRVSHYNEKVRWALDYKGWKHRRETQIPGLHIPRTRWLSGQNQLPVLQLEGRVLAGSARILEELEHLRPLPPLFPTDPALRARTLAIQAHYDEEVAPELRRLFWSTYIDAPELCALMATDGFSDSTRRLWQGLLPLMRPLLRRNMGIDSARIREARANLRKRFDDLAAQIGTDGYLAGPAFSVADLAAAAVMTAIVRPAGFPYPLPQPVPAAFTELQASVQEHPGYRWVQDIYRRHRPASCEVAD